MPLGTSLYSRLAESSGTVYYVRTDGNNGNSGLTNSAGGAWASPNYAADNAPANSIVKIVSGNYVETVSLSRGFSSSTPVTLEAFDPANRPVIGSLLADSGGVAAYWRFRNLIFDVQLLDPDGSLGTSGTRFDGVKIGSNGSTEHDIELYGCTIKNATGQGFNQQGHVTNIHVINCDIFNSGWYPGAGAGTSHTLYLRYGSNCMYLNLLVYAPVPGYALQVHSDGLETGLQDSILANCIFDDSSTRAGFRLSQPDVTAQANLHQRNTIKNCIVSNNGTYGFQILIPTSAIDPATGDENEFDRCIRYNNTSGAITNTTNAIFTNQTDGNPLFVNQASRDYHLQAGSPAIQAGDEAYTPTFDFTGAARVHADIGPYAYTADDPTLPTRMPESSGTTYYVGGTGASDANAGTNPAAPWATLNKAFTDAPADAIVKVRPGTYAETIACTRGGTDINSVITIEAESTKPVLQGNLRLEGINAAYWRLRNMIFNANDTSDSSLKITYTGADAGAANVGAHHIELYGCEAHNTLGAGGTYLVTGTSVHDIQWWNCLGYDADPTSNEAHGWYLDGGSNLYLINCISRDNGGYGYHCYNGSGVQALRDVYFHNCLADAQVLRSGFIIRSDATQAAAVANPDLLIQAVHFYNCISTNHQSATTAYGFRIYYPNMTDFSLVPGFDAHTMDNCLSYNNASGDLFVGIPTTDILTNTGFITAQNPLYSDQPNNDFHITAGSPAIQAGQLSNTPSFDYAGTNRVHADIGPYAYTADDPPPVTFVRSRRAST
jgi:hypothetical protein